MKFEIVWTDQVENYVRSKAPGPRRELWRAIKSLGQWDGRENPPNIRFLEDELLGYHRLRVNRERIIFRESFQDGRRLIKCLLAEPRNTVYETFAELFLDEVAD